MKSIKKLNSGGFSLIEVMVVLAIISIILAIAIMNLNGTQRAVRDTVAINRLVTVVEAQTQYKGLGGNRFGTVTELAGATSPQGKLVPETVLTVDGSGVSQPIDGWLIEQTPGASVSPSYLRNKFDIRVRKSDASGTDKIYCVHDDALIRVGTFGGGCDRNSPVLKK